MLINLVDNRRYYLDDTIKPSEIIEKTIDKEKRYFCGNKIVNLFKKVPNPITTANLDGVEFLEKKSDESETLVLKMVTKNGETYIQTGNMIGEFYFKDAKTTHQINIGLRFDKKDNTTILEYLINYANAIYPDKVELTPKKTKKQKTNSIAKLILAKMFSNSLSRAFVMGLPTYYESFQRSGYDVRGKIDIDRLIAKELPFKGITPYIANERVIEKNIGAVLLKTIEMVEHEVKSFNILSQVKATLKQSNIKPIVTSVAIQKAQSSKVLRNMAYSEYKNTLKLALMIIQGFKTPDLKDSKGLFYGYLVDISKIWENYLVKLFQTNFGDNWKVEVEPELELFKHRPNLHKLTNTMYPDIVLKHKVENKVMVFDAKFKQSNWFNREDFYKTATYISYYKNHGFDVVLGGQIYPDIKADKINENLGFLGANVDFRLMGIHLSCIENKIEKDMAEDNFIERIKQISGESS